MCGIAGIINKTPRTFDYATFCTLGISNDARGGDSCGVFIDGRYEYGVGDNKFFSTYFQERKLLEETEKSTIALVHCRKASVGVISEKTAQPVVITDEAGVAKFVVMHNGTIYNYEKLAKKYIPHVDITGMTDSQVMAHIFYYAGYEVLNEYNGAAVFAIVDYREGVPRTFFFRGSSKKYTQAKDTEPERPLYYCIDKVKREMVFSSIWMYLMAVRRDCTTYSLRTNELVEFNGTSLVTIKKYERLNMIQNREYDYGTSLPLYNSKEIRTYKQSTIDSNIYDDDAWFDSGSYVAYDNYISIDLINNIYSYRGRKIQGKLTINDFGRVASKLSRGTDIWFFGGVALKSKSCFNFLSSLKKESNLSDRDFFYKFENVIRFLSIDATYPIDGRWFEATSPTGKHLFTGKLRPLTSATVINFAGGSRISTMYKGERESLKSRIPEKLELNFKTIKEECKSLMK